MVRFLVGVEFLVLLSMPSDEDGNWVSGEIGVHVHTQLQGLCGLEIPYWGV
jgi:hypothetical protein